MAAVRLGSLCQLASDSATRPILFRRGIAHVGGVTAPPRPRRRSVPPPSLHRRSVIHNDAPVPLRLKPSRQFPFLARHPWVHAHALIDLGEELSPGQVVDLLDFDGNWLARGLINPASRLRVRLYSFDSSVELSEDLWERRIDAAIGRRRLAGEGDPEAGERLVFSESDLLSGLIVDRYADCLSVQFTAGALLRWKDPILDHLSAQTGCRRMFVRVEEKTARYEGINPLADWSSGVPPSEPLVYRQNGLSLTVDLDAGQKTGSYLDQRLNHVAAASYLRDRRVLDVCCYAGGFGLVAAKGGARSVVGVDSSEPALAAARKNASRNNLDAMEFVKADCFDDLKRRGEAGETFDAVILDPPRFAGSRKQIAAALRAYQRLNSLAVDLLPAGGMLVTCSCSGRVSRSDFLNLLVDVGRRRRRDLIILENRGSSPDHPMAVSCPESDYLKCLIAEVQ